MAGELRGRRVGAFTLVELVGSGGFAEVYRATQDGLDREVAVKILDPYLARDPRSATRFKREATAVASMDHPAILPVFAAGEDDGLVYMAMRLVRGHTLQDRLAEGPPLRAQALLDILQPVADGLAHAHRSGFVHRDVKPANIMIEQSERAARPRVWLTDFGIARAVESDEQTTSQGIGTADYMAPEQARGEDDLGPPTDLYSLGCVAYHCLIGERPFQRATALATVAAHLHDPVPVGHGPDLDAFFAKALAKDPADRFRTSAEFMRALRTVVDTGATNPITPLAVGPRRDAEGGRSRSRRRTLLAASVAAGLAGLIALVVLVIVSMGSRVPSPQESVATQGFAPPAAPTTGQQAIAFAADGGSGLDIFVADGTGTDPVRITEQDGDERQAAWSPDGTRIAFAGDASGASRIYLVPAEPGARPIILSAGPDEREPDWSPDGSRIVAARVEGDGSRVLVMIEVATREETVLEGTRGQVFRPTFVPPDGERIAFHAVEDGSADIFIVDADPDATPVRLAGVPGANDGHPSFSSDGRVLSFSTELDGAARIAIVPLGADGVAAPPELLTPGGLEAFEADLSADGLSIAFRGQENGVSRIYVIATRDGAEPQLLVEGAEPAWAPSN